MLKYEFSDQLPSPAMIEEKVENMYIQTVHGKK